MFEIGAKIEEGWSSDNREKGGAASSETFLTPEEHSLKISLGKRRGKWVTSCSPFFLSKEDRRQLLGSLKKELGCGGSFKGDTLELQGQWEKELHRALQHRGYFPKD